MLNKRKYSRVFILVIDGMGVGSLPDSRKYGDKNTSCLEDVLYKEKGAKLPNFEKMGIGHLTNYPMEKNKKTIAHFGKIRMKSKYKDSWAGHWEIGGVSVPDNYSAFIDKGFDDKIIKDFEEKTGLTVLGNEAIIYREDKIYNYIEEHKKNKNSVIVLTEVGKETIRTFGIYILEDNMSLDKQYELCEKSAEYLKAYKNLIGRIGSRPMVIDKEGKVFVPHPDRRDFLMFDPPQKTLLTNLSKHKIGVHTAGKVSAMFKDIGVTENRYSRTNDECYKEILYYMDNVTEGLIFATFNDMDCMYATARDSRAWKECLEDLDVKIEKVIKKMKVDDLLIICADGHGADPVYTGLHTREYSPLFLVDKDITDGINVNDILHRTIYLEDIEATIADNFCIKQIGQGKSFLELLIKK